VRTHLGAAGDVGRLDVRKLRLRDRHVVPPSRLTGLLAPRPPSRLVLARERCER